MKKAISLVAASAMLLSVATIALASVNQFTFVNSTTKADSNTGGNFGGKFVFTGDSASYALSGTAGNVNVGGHHVSQGSFVTSSTNADSNTGHNFGGVVVGTGDSGAVAGSVTVGNASVSGFGF